MGNTVLFAFNGVGNSENGEEAWKLLCPAIDKSNGGKNKMKYDDETPAPAEGDKPTEGGDTNTGGEGQ